MGMAYLWVELRVSASDILLAADMRSCALHLSPQALSQGLADAP